MSIKSVVIKFEPIEKGIPRRIAALHQPVEDSVLFTEQIWKVIRENNFNATLFFTAIDAIKDEYSEIKDNVELENWVSGFKGEIKLGIF